METFYIAKFKKVLDTTLFLKHLKKGTQWTFISYIWNAFKSKLWLRI